jgi:hypothetical protein
MSLGDIPRMIKRLQALEASAQTVAQQMADLNGNVSVSQNSMSQSQDSFVKEVQDSIGVSMSASLEVAKEKIQEEIKAYVNDQMAILLAKLEDMQVQVDNVHTIASSAVTSAADASAAASVAATAAAAAASFGTHAHPAPAPVAAAAAAAASAE